MGIEQTAGHAEQDIAVTRIKQKGRTIHENRARDDVTHIVGPITSKKAVGVLFHWKGETR
jgi:hypothetical protein